RARGEILRKHPCVTVLMPPRPPRLVVSEEFAEPARGQRRRPSQAKRRAEILVIGINVVRLEKQVRIESGERRIMQDVNRLAEILVSQAQSQGQRWRGLPSVLKKVRLPEVVRVEDGR